MLTFKGWLKESLDDESGRLESAVREFMKSNPESKKCYYVTHPKNMHFDPKNPRHLEDELGPNYDRSLEVVPFKHHPLSFTCKNSAFSLAEFLRKKGFKARAVAGWYGNAERGYHAGYSPGLNDPNPPRGFGNNPQQHWWVETGDYIIDLTSAQFHPTTPQDQKDLVIRSKGNSIYDGSYSAVSRETLGRAVRLPPNVSRMVDKILSLKKFAAGHSSIQSDNDSLAEWISKNRERFSLPLSVAQDSVAALRASRRPGFYFADRRMLERTFGEAFDDIEEDSELKSQDSSAAEFKPNKSRFSKGTVRHYGSRITLSSTYPDDMDENFATLKELIMKYSPDSEFGEPEKYSERGAYGNKVFYIASSLKNIPRFSPELLEELRTQKFSVK